MTVVQFDSQDPFEILADAVPIREITELTRATFQPRGSTPLLDATGDLISHATKRAERRKEAGKKPESTLLVTFTDGQENASRRTTRSDLTELVADKEAEGWTFAFLGAGLDAYGESHAIGYAPGSVQEWSPDGAGAGLAFASLSRAATSHRDKVRRAVLIDPGDFFEGHKAAEADRKRRDP